jgi:hypothetical protein
MIHVRECRSLSQLRSEWVARARTSKEDDAELPELPILAGVIDDTLPARSMATYRIEGVTK